MLDHPGQRLKLPDGPRVEPRSLLERCLRNMEIDNRISEFLVVNLSIFLGLKNFTNYDKTPPYFTKHFTNMEIKEI